MIYTITLNPALDRTLWVQKIQPDESNRVEGKTLKEALTYAVAAGTATTLRPGTALCEKDDVLKLVPEIALHTAEGS